MAAHSSVAPANVFSLQTREHIRSANAGRVDFGAETVTPNPALNAAAPRAGLQETRKVPDLADGAYNPICPTKLCVSFIKDCPRPIR